ncbi:transposase [Streptomyces koyangensis]|uniref:transposase n=1 Tax=Streptomyces koyangensis TaxID=188770 RepID=UPI003C2D7B6F
MPYSTGLSDEQWSLIEPLVAAWKQERVARSATGDPGSCDLREVVNALLYQNRTGCQRRLPPHDLPASSSVFSYFTLWRQDGLDQRIQEALRCRVRERERARQLEDPSLVIIDIHSVRVAAGVAKKTTGLVLQQHFVIMGYGASGRPAVESLVHADRCVVRALANRWYSATTGMLVFCP